ncbi:hypothetical protein HPB51_016227 [Rhipicephalus microplus]|uniref:Transposable element P transposase-like RNase H domain-containing protein n=1 Tax=Rhipicephalus microplus TaxID=6941 RepID=A0A9J6EHP9_RHIMP|nr:hypothetical protein HPB51_016227 [Rhipicephalus microplus]
MVPIVLSSGIDSRHVHLPAKLSSAVEYGLPTASTMTSCPEKCGDSAQARQVSALSGAVARNCKVSFELPLLLLSWSAVAFASPITAPATLMVPIVLSSGIDSGRVHLPAKLSSALEYGLPTASTLTSRPEKNLSCCFHRASFSAHGNRITSSFANLLLNMQDHFTEDQFEPIILKNTGEKKLRELGQPLPTERTLHRHLEGYKCTPGLLEGIMALLAIKVSLMSPEERHATLMLDETQLAPGLVYNPSSGTVLGAPTIPLADGTLPPECLATHGLVFMLSGITTRWKQTVAYHLTGNSFHAKAVKDIIIVIIKACEAISLKVDVVVTDMGRGNQATWILFGIIVGKHSKPKTSCPHPCDASR